MNIESQAIVRWLLSTGVRIGGIIVGFAIVLGIVHLFIVRARRRLARPERIGVERAKRAETITKILEAVIRVAVIGAATLMILRHLGIDVAPLLAGAGIVGLAVSFGAQNLVKDMLNGFFILLENNINVGDVVEIAGVSGVVEKVGMRVTELRDLEGKLHAIPNGEITIISNLTKEWSRAVIAVDVSYREDIDRVAAILRAVGDELTRDDTHGPGILEPMEMLGVEKFGDSAVTVKLMFKTQPGKQWQVAREFRRRVKLAFDAAGIRIPYPHRTIDFEGSAFPASPGIGGTPRS